MLLIISQQYIYTNILLAGTDFIKHYCLKKQIFYSNLNMEDITKHAKRVWKRFGKKILVIIMIYMFKAIHCYLQMYLKPFEINALKYMNLIQLFFISTWISMAILLKKETEVKWWKEGWWWCTYAFEKQNKRSWFIIF